MPKKNRVLTKTLYTYVRPINSIWVRREARKRQQAYSEFLDEVITALRTKERVYRKKPGRLARAA